MRHRRHLLSEDSSENFWPSFTDLTSTIVLILFVLVLLAYVRNLISGKNLEFAQSQLSQTNQRLSQSEREVQASATKLRALEDELRGTAAQIQQQRALVEESNRQLSTLQSRLQGIAVLRVEVLNKVKQSVEAELGPKSTSGAPLVQIGDNGNIVINESLVFEYNSHTLKSEAKPLLATLARSFANLLGDANVRESIDVILVQGHTDERGGSAYNRDLSAKRANAVLDFLFASNPLLESSFGRYFASSAYSKFRPVNPGQDEPAYQQNRRIEISIVPRDVNVSKVIGEYLESLKTQVAPTINPNP